MCLEVSSDMNPFEKHITEAEKLLNKYETKLNQYNGTKVQTDFVPLNEVSLADEAWHSKMSEGTYVMLIFDIIHYSTTAGLPRILP